MTSTPNDNAPERPSPHPICLLIPPADEGELQDLTDDIRAHGLIDPIVLFEGMILDGRSRAAACARAGVAPRYRAIHRRPGRRSDPGGFAQPQAASPDASSDRRRAGRRRGFQLELRVRAGGPRRIRGRRRRRSPRGRPAEAVIKITEPKTASSRKLAAAGRRPRQPCHDRRHAQGQGQGRTGIPGGGEAGAHRRAGRRQGRRPAARATKGHRRSAKAQTGGGGGGRSRA